MGFPQLTVAMERADQSESIALVAELDAYLQPLYPAESQHGISVAELMRPGVLFAVARSPAGEALGIGAVVLHADYGELKRMFVPEMARGQGIGRAVLEFLEAQCLAQGRSVLRLETGVAQPEAIRLYERAGYRRRPPFAGYRDDPLSLFMEKALSRSPA